MARLGTREGVGNVMAAGLGVVTPADCTWSAGTTYANADNPFGVLVAVGLGIPLYSNAAGIMPLVEVLYAKGMPMGTVLAFMMAVVALSLPEMTLLRRVLQPKLHALFIAVVAPGIVVVGYLFNAVLGSGAPTCP